MRLNLIFYIYLTKSTYLDYNLKLLSHYADVFDGEIVIIIARDRFNDYQIDLPKFKTTPKIINVKNNRELGETQHFFNGINSIKNSDSYTFYAHAKGVSREPTFALNNWVASLYFYNLEKEYLPTSTEYTFSGAILKNAPCPPYIREPYHFSGTFFWFNTEEVKKNLDQLQNVQKTRYFVESFPARIEPDVNKVKCTFYRENNNFNLYNDAVWKGILNKNRNQKYKELINKSMGEKDIAILTVVTNNYDEVKIDPAKNVKYDHVIITDDEHIRLLNREMWHIITVEKSDDPRKQSRKYKILGHEYLKENYEGYLYVDPNHTIRPNIDTFIKNLGYPKNDWCVKMHPFRKDIIKEGEKIIELKKDTAEIVNAQLEAYKDNKIDNLYENGIFLRSFQNENINKMCEDWYEEILKHSYRDQLSLPYIFYKHNYTPPKVFKDAHLTNFFIYNKHVKGKSIVSNKDYKPKVWHFVPADEDKNLGKAYNEHCELVPNDDDWICMRDGDTAFLYPFFQQQICDIIREHGDKFDLISCTTNRLGLKHQLHNNTFSNNLDLRHHSNIAFKLAEEQYTTVKETKLYTAGLFMLFKKSTWLRNGKFSEGLTTSGGRNIFIDADFSQRILKWGKIGIAKGIYLLHLYRIHQDNPQTYKHLM